MHNVTELCFKSITTARIFLWMVQAHADELEWFLLNS